MATEVRMPQLGLTREEATIAKWIKQEGDKIICGDILVEITTDKLSSEIESEVDGYLLKIVALEGDDIPVKGLIAIIGEEGEKVDEILSPKSQVEVKAEETYVKFEADVAPKALSVTQSGRIKASPLAKKIAADLGVDLTTLEGSGPNGRIVQKDVLSAESKLAAS
ncbi:MAG: hypothetical protein GX818_10600, partial [Tissierellia bacterium]|nr:hypothetical protein [Tissierellia bacterium]